MIYEGLLLFAVVFLAGYLFDTLSQSRHALTLRPVRQLWLFLWIGIYFVWFWTHGGQTLPMKTWRMRVVGADGKALRPGRAVLRYLLCWIFLLPALALAEALGTQGWVSVAIAAIALIVPPFWMKFDRDGQSLHDRLAGTRLIVA